MKKPEIAKGKAMKERKHVKKWTQGEQEKVPKTRKRMRKPRRKEINKAVLRQIQSPKFSL